jgi:hypothetical protein
VSDFERVAFRELKLAAKMDCLASRRALTAKALRNGKNVRKSQLQKLNRQMKRMAEDFSELWLVRNKPSRLRDNLKLFRRVQDGK